MWLSWPDRLDTVLREHIDREQDMLEHGETVNQVMSCWAERELTLTFARQAILHLCLAAEARHFEHASVQKVHHDWGGA
jgi:hypothetical protein